MGIGMTGFCDCEGVVYLCPPIPMRFEPRCVDCDALIIWRD